LKTLQLLAAFALVAAGVVVLQLAERKETKRASHQRDDLGGPRREVAQSRVEFTRGKVAQ
jgi:hypothetical protein